MLFSGEAGETQHSPPHLGPSREGLAVLVQRAMGCRGVQALKPHRSRGQRPRSWSCGLCAETIHLNAPHLRGLQVPAFPVPSHSLSNGWAKGFRSLSDWPNKHRPLLKNHFFLICLLLLIDTCFPLLSNEHRTVTLDGLLGKWAGLRKCSRLLCLSRGPGPCDWPPPGHKPGAV